VSNLLSLDKAGRTDEGIRYSQIEIEIHPTLGLAWDALGRALFISGRLAEAVDASRKAPVLVPDKLNVIRNYAFVALRN